jgi:hypothetical protein
LQRLAQRTLRVANTDLTHVVTVAQHDGRERRHNGQLLRRHRSDSRPSGIRSNPLFVAALGSGGYASRRDFSFLYRLLFWLLLALIAAPLAAGIFLDVLNIFLLFLRIFGRSS